MTAPQHIDPERLAALLEGRLSTAEAATVREQLARADDETLSAYADAVEIHGQLNASAIVPIHSARRVPRWTVGALAAAAAVVVAVFALRPAAYAPARYASALPESAHASSSPVWSVMRGGADGVADRARAVRVGVLLTDLQLDAIRGDSADAHASGLATLLEGVPGNKPRADALRQAVSSNPRVTPSQAQSLGQQAARGFDQASVRIGAYLEAARVAAAQGDTAFFDRATATDLSPLGSDAEYVTSAIAAKPRSAAAIHAAVEAALRKLTQ